jgi:hypothetical protein
MEQQIERMIRANENITISEKHYLWYRRRGPDLILSGSDTETKEDFERIKAMGEVNSLAILSGLKELR